MRKRLLTQTQYDHDEVEIQTLIQTQYDHDEVEIQHHQAKPPPPNTHQRLHKGRLVSTMMNNIWRDDRLMIYCDIDDIRISRSCVWAVCIEEDIPTADYGDMNQNEISPEQKYSRHS